MQRVGKRGEPCLTRRDELDVRELLTFEQAVPGRSRRHAAIQAAGGDTAHLSYDLYLLKQDAAAGDLAAAYEQLEEHEEREPTPEEETQLRQLAADLQAASPGLDLTESDSGFLLQLGYEAERTVVIDIGPDEITMSWSFGAEAAAPALAEVRTHLRVFERHGYVAYDPQLERAFDPDRDSAEAEAVHRDVRDQLSEAYGPLVGERRPWWKRLFR